MTGSNGKSDYVYHRNGRLKNKQEPKKQDKYPNMYRRLFQALLTEEIIVRTNSPWEIHTISHTPISRQKSLQSLEKLDLCMKLIIHSIHDYSIMIVYCFTPRGGGSVLSDQFPTILDSGRRRCNSQAKYYGIQEESSEIMTEKGRAKTPTQKRYWQSFEHKYKIQIQIQNVYLPSTVI